MCVCISINFYLSKKTKPKMEIVGRKKKRELEIDVFFEIRSYSWLCLMVQCYHALNLVTKNVVYSRNLWMCLYKYDSRMIHVWFTYDTYDSECAYVFYVLQYIYINMYIYIYHFFLFRNKYIPISFMIN
jgi:hypothetical protein